MAEIDSLEPLDRDAFERLVLQLTGRDMDYHARNGTTGLDTAWICYRAGLTAAQPAPPMGQVLAFENPITRDDVAESEIARLRADRDVLLNALTHISEDGWDDSESWQDLWARTKKTARAAMEKANSIR